MKKKLLKALQGLLSLALGAAIALCILPCALANFADDPFWLFEAKIILCFIPACLCYMLMVILHEGGHLLAGLASGYTFVSFRVMSLMLVRLDGKLLLRRFSLAGTGGQCLMKPPAWTGDGIPVQLYNWGGVIANAIGAALSGLLLLVFPASTFGGMLVLLMLVCNVFGLLTNGIPMMHNDADNALHLTRDPAAMRAFWAQMMGNALLAEGTAIPDIPEDLYAVPQDADLANPLIAASAASAAQLLLSHRRFDEADAAIADVLARGAEALPPVVRMLLTGDRVWYELMHENRPEVLDGLQTKEFRQYQKAMKNYPAVLRVQYTQALAEGRREDAARVRTQMERIARTYPYRQETDEELALMRLADERFAPPAM